MQFETNNNVCISSVQVASEYETHSHIDTEMIPSQTVLTKPDLIIGSSEVSEETLNEVSR
jgi:hypothetical protein